jgi:hypothetical protein
MSLESDIKRKAEELEIHKCGIIKPEAMSGRPPARAHGAHTERGSGEDRRKRFAPEESGKRVIIDRTPAYSSIASLIWLSFNNILVK